MSTSRNPSIIVARLRWSMAQGRPVRITLRDSGGVSTGKVARVEVDPKRAKVLAETPASKVPKGASTIVAVMAGGAEYAVDSIAKVQLPHGDSGAAFMDGE